MIKNCQSCGNALPMKNDPKGEGAMPTAASPRCTVPIATKTANLKIPTGLVGQMRDFCRQKLREMGFPGLYGRMVYPRHPKIRAMEKIICQPIPVTRS